MIVPPLGCYGVVSISNDLEAALIRLGTRSIYNHAFVVVSNTGHIVEAWGSGARLSNLSRYADQTVAFNDAEPMTEAQRQAVADKATSLLGTPYGYLDIALLGLMCAGFHPGWLTGRVEHEKALICSQLVAVCGDAAGLDWNCGKPSPALVTPGDLAVRITEHTWSTK